MYHIIVNPASRSGRGQKLWALTEPLLSEKNISYQVFFSEKAGDLIQIIGNLSASYFKESVSEPLKLILLGGDGTLNEALQGISDFERTWIGYIPTGSSNDMARDLKLSGDPAEALNRILSCKNAVPMDLGCVTYHHVSDRLSRKHDPMLSKKRYFAVSAGIGFDAAVCEEALASGFKNILNKLSLGKLTYLIIALKQLIAAKKVSIMLSIDGREPICRKRFLFTAGMIHQYQGGGFRFCPDADFHDGLLDVCCVGDVPKWLILLALPTAFFGKHYCFPGIDRYFGKTLRIKTSAPLWVHTDGEVSFLADDITLTCDKNKLNMLI